MADQEMIDYLPNISADYTATNFTLKPQSVLIESGGFKQIIREGDDGSEERILMSTTPKFVAVLGWNSLSESDAGTIMDFYFDTAKGAGGTRTFQWEHPTDGHTYVVRFEGNLSREYLHASLYKYAQLRLRVLGY